MSQLLHLLDRPVAFQRSFVRLGAGVTGALLLSQLVYWQNRMNGQWFYKTQAELEEETGLSRYEQEGARKKLVSVGVLEEQKKGIPAKLYFRVNEIILAEYLLSKNQQPGMGDFPEPVCGNSASIPTVDYTEITTEITTEIKNTMGEAADAPPPRRVSEQGYSEEFEEAWRNYPKREGGNNKQAAWKAWKARIKQGYQATDMVEGVKRYAAHLAATGSAGTRYVKQASTFFGPDCHFSEEWHIAEKQPETQPRPYAYQDSESSEVFLNLEAMRSDSGGNRRW